METQSKLHNEWISRSFTQLASSLSIDLFVFKNPIQLSSRVHDQVTFVYSFHKNPSFSSSFAVIILKFGFDILNPTILLSDMVKTKKNLPLQDFPVP